jgi:hypothetical protein
LQDRIDVEEKKMFGGLCFMVSNHMCCGIEKDTLMARVSPHNYAECLTRKHVREMDFTGNAMIGMVYISPEGIESDDNLAKWLKICTTFVESLPVKIPKWNKWKDIKTDER